MRNWKDCCSCIGWRHNVILCECKDLSIEHNFYIEANFGVSAYLGIRTVCNSRVRKQRSPHVNECMVLMESTVDEKCHSDVV